ncbi:ankyrin repeat-containing domain protein [Dactylonectria estremocensis]|uniref:Ankyrin repeat-containing domain protein n=1 Tax=Dactylonectria estremocensis TaxID=1079267 RepID=A0A9P9E996_9HYPO|nr:ankyrin repeat-containing domain protein [Dactylonectria estremocensis]
MSRFQAAAPGSEIIVVQDVSRVESSDMIADIRLWLKPTKYNLDSSDYHRNLASHLAGTGSWLLSRPEYKQWHDSPDHGLLWIKGIPGSGKSVMAARMVHVLAQEGPVLYFFFRQHQPINLIRDWLDQVLVYSPHLQAILGDYIKHRRSLDSVCLEDLWQHLCAALAELPLAYCVVDALDEMVRENDLVRLLAELGQWRPAHVKVFMTSRPVATVETSMRRVESIQVYMKSGDIVAYVRHRLEQSRLSESDKEAIKKAVPNDVFLYAKLAMDSFLEPNADIPNILQNTPSNLDQMYRGILKEHGRSGILESTQLQILQWVIHATRPLRLLELADMLKTDNGTLSLKEYKALIRSACRPLLEILPDETVQVIHYSLTEFLTTSFTESESHTHLAIVCLRHMRGCLDGKHETLAFPFAAYAVDNWHAHAAKGIWSRDLFNQVDSFLSSPLQWLKLCWDDDYGHGHDATRPKLHIAAFCGLGGYISKHVELQGTPEMDVRDGDGRTPLWYAASRGMTGTVKVLLQLGAAVNTEDTYNVTPLYQATENRHSEVVKLLLEAGADPQTPVGKDRRTPLRSVFEHGHLDMVNAFMPHLTLDAKQQALFWAVGGGILRSSNTRIVRRLLQDGVDPNIVHDFRSPLFVSASWGDVDSMEALIEAGADVSIQCTAPARRSPDWPYGLLPPASTALEAFCINPAKDRVRFQRGLLLLVQAGADVNSKSVHGLSPVHFARSLVMLELLFEAGADLNAATATGETVLHRLPAAGVSSSERQRQDDGAYLKFLMEAGADMDKREDTCKTPLLTAITTNCHLALKMLEYEPDCSVADYDGNGPLHLALSGREPPLPSLLSALLSAGANVDSRNRNGETPLHVLASRLGVFYAERTDDEALRLLLGNGAKIDARDSQGQTPLFKIIGKPPPDITIAELEIFRAGGARLDIVDARGRTLLHEVARTCLDSRESRTKLYRYLVEGGISPFVADFDGNTLYHEVARLRYDLDLEHLPELLEEFERSGLDVNQSNLVGQTPLHLACHIRSTKYNRVHSCLALLLEKSNVGAADYQGLTPIHYAASISDHAVNLLLRHGADPFAVTREGMNALHIAARCRKSNILGRILFKMKDLSPKMATEAVNQRNQAEYTPLHYACRSGRPESVALLIEAGAEVEPSYRKSRILVGEPWFSPIFQCAFFSQEQLLWENLDKSMDGTGGLTINDKSRPTDEDNEVPSSTFRPLHHATRCEEIVRTLLKAGVNLYMKSQWGGPAIFDAMAHAARHRNDYVTALLFRLHNEMGGESPDPFFGPILVSNARWQSDTKMLRETTVRDDWFAVSQLLVERQYTLIEELYQAGADFTLKTELEDSVLCQFAYGGLADLLDRCSSKDVESLVLPACFSELPNMDVLRVLEKKGARMNPRSGTTPLHVFAEPTKWWQVAQAIPYFVSQGADLEARDDQGRTPLHVAAASTSNGMAEDAIKALLELGADPNATNHGVSCLDMAEGKECFVRLLVRHGAKISTMAVRQALQRQNLGLLKVLLSAELIKSWPNVSDAIHPLLQASCFGGSSMLGGPSEKASDFGVQAMRALLEAGVDPDDTCQQLVYKPQDLSSLCLVAHNTWENGHVSFESEASKTEVTLVHEILSFHRTYQPILDLPLELERRDASGATLLLAACKRRGFYRVDDTTQVFLSLLKRGANPIAVDKFGRNVLHHALGSRMSFGDKLVVLKALDTVVPTLVNQVDVFGYYPLHYGLSSFGSASFIHGFKHEIPLWVHYLFAIADVTVVDGDGNNMLHYLACGLVGFHSVLLYEHAHALFRRIAESVDVNARNNAGEVPIHLFFSMIIGNSRFRMAKERSAIVKAMAMLDDLGANWQVRDDKGRTVLHFLANKDDYMFEQAVARGVDPLLEDSEGRTSLDIGGK